MKNFDDFTERHYRELIGLAKGRFRFTTFDNTQSKDDFVLWRHDCDFSLERALSLAKIENEEGVIATYFLNPNSEFYNINEKSQQKIIRQIAELGHHIELHFDAAYYDVDGQDDLERGLAIDKQKLSLCLNISPSVFSFHNPNQRHLRFQSFKYGGLINCYSQCFRSKINYHSDSNGYWRFGRLKDFLTDPANRQIQILTHPGWWQVEAMAPRDRILRASYGRAAATMRLYDATLEHDARRNLGGSALMLRGLENGDDTATELLRVLWSQKQFGAILGEVLRSLHSMAQHLTLDGGQLLAENDVWEKFIGVASDAFAIEDEVELQSVCASCVRCLSRLRNTSDKTLLASLMFEIIEIEQSLKSRG